MRSGNSNAAQKEAEANRKLSQRQFSQQMKLMEKQLKAQKQLAPPAPEPMAPMATRSASDAAAQRREMSRAAGRRYGFAQSVSGSMLGSPTIL
jgi:hypothetical protein